MTRKKSALILIILQAFYVLFLPVWLFFTGLSVMMFDSPGSEDHIGLILLFIAIAAYPLGLLGGLIASWVAFSRQKYRGAIRLNLIPMLWLLPIAGMLLYANLM